MFCVLLRIANRSGISQISEHMYRRSEDEAEYNWIPGWDVPSGWIEPNPKNLDDLCCPKEGTVQFRFATRDDAALHEPQLARELERQVARAERSHERLHGRGRARH